MASGKPNTPSGEQEGLRRLLSSFDCVMIVAGVVVGVGIFINPSEVARTLRSPAAILAAWVLGGVAAILGGIACAKLGRFLPRAGGLYVYLREAYHPGVAFLYGWTVLLAVFSGVSAAVSLTFARYAAVLFPALSRFERTLAFLLIAALALLNYRGTRLSGTVQNLLTLAKLAAIALLTSIALATVELPSAAAPAPPPDAGTFLFALLPVFMSYGGWYTLTFLAADVRRPERALPIGIVGGLFLVIAAYALINAAYMKVLTVAEMADSPAVAAAVAERVMGAAGARVVALLVVVSAPAVVNVLLLAGSRLYFAMAEDGLFFRRAAWLHPTYGSPVWSIAAQAAWSVVLLASHTYGQLLQLSMFSEWTFFALIGASVFVFAARDPSFYDSRVERLSTNACAAFFTALAAAVVINAVYRSPSQFLLGILLMLTGFPVYFAWRRRSAGAQRNGLRAAAS